MIECNEITNGVIQKAKELYILRKREVIEWYIKCIL
jgi:hypothetical protein